MPPRRNRARLAAFVLATLLLLTAGGAVPRSADAQSAAGQSADSQSAAAQGAGAQSAGAESAAAPGAPGGGPPVQWVYGYGGAETEEHPHAAVQTADGGYVIVGESGGEAATRIFVVRTDERGAARFARSYGAGRINLGNFVLEEADGSVLVAGSWDAGRGAVREDRVLLRLAPDGAVAARRTYPAAGRDAIEGITLNADGSVIAVGYRGAAQEELTSFLVDSGRGFVMKLDAGLNVVWERPTPDRFFQPFRVLPRGDAPGYAVFGACRGRAGQTVFCLAFSDEQGNLGAPLTYGAGTSHPYDFDAAPDGGYILAGHVSSCTDGCWDGWLVRVDAAGRELWNLAFGEPNGGSPERMFEECYGVRSVPGGSGGGSGGGFIAACASGVEPGNEARPDDPLNTWRAYVVRVTEAGAIRWQATYGSPHANNAAEFVLPARGGGFAVFADSDEHGPGWGNFALYRLAGDPPPAP